MTMNPIEDLPPQLALEKLRSLHPLVYQAIEQAVEEAREFFSREKTPYEPYLFANLVRYKTRRLLAELADGPIMFGLSNLANNGIEIEYDGIVIRVWKADEGQLPAPGVSRAKQEFYYQPYLPDLDISPEPVRLAVIWDTDSDHGLRELLLVCPKGANEPWMPGESHWLIPIPHPATAMKPAGGLAEATPDVEDARAPNVKTGTPKE